MNLINRLAERGVAVILISSELPELMAMSDRFVVMAEGQISGELLAKRRTESKDHAPGNENVQAVLKWGRIQP